MSLESVFAVAIGFSWATIVAAAIKYLMSDK